MTATAEVRDVFVSYGGAGGAAGAVMALRGVNLEIGAGELLLLQGPNGSGKSTLLRVLTGEQLPTAGRVTVGGTELSELSPGARRRWRRRSIGFVDQHARRSLLPEWPVLDNIALQLRVAGESRWTARQRSAETLAALGLTTLAERGIGTLSGGEAQRVAICAAMAHRPTLMLADEPTTELDDAAAAGIYELLRQAAGAGVSVVLVSHESRALGIADRVVRFRNGRLADEWSPGSAEAQVIDPDGWVRLLAAVRRPGLRSVRFTTPDDSGSALTITGSYSLELPTVAAPTTHVPITAVPVAMLPLASATPLLVLTAVSARAGDRVLFDDVDLSLTAGDLVVVRGPSGSGKSTLLKIAAGLTDPVRGSVVIGDTTVAGLTRNERALLRRNRLAMALQSTFLAEALTVLENLRFAAELRGRSAAAEREVKPAIGDIVGNLALEGLLDRQVRLLSGGERQRVAVARCLVASVPVLVLDEPTSQQDEISAGLVAAAMSAAAANGRAVLAATHDAQVIDRATRLLDLGAQPPRYAAATESSSRSFSAGPSMFR